MAHPSISYVSSTGATLVGRTVRNAMSQLVAFFRALKHRSEVRNLAEFDDRMLKDIGLTRSDVDGALQEPIFHNPSVLLVRSAERRERAQRMPAQRRTDRPTVALVKAAG